jgi:uncharacterized membrane protein YoaK (UPF0700 family)
MSSTPSFNTVAPVAGRQCVETEGPKKDYMNMESKDSKASADSQQKAANKEKASFVSPEMWMLIVGNILALSSGIVDAGTILLFKAGTTHMTGNTAYAGLNLDNGFHGDGFAAFGKFALLLLCFMSGSFVCGLMIPKGYFRFGGTAMYGTALILASVLLFVSAGKPAPSTTPFLAAIASGLQNAMCTIHYGAVFRTTHVTGTITDIGSILGRVLMIWLHKGFQRNKLSLLDKAELDTKARKLLVLIPVFICFFVGACFGSLATRNLDYENRDNGIITANVLYIPASITGFFGISYVVVSRLLQEQMEVLEESRWQNDLARIKSMLIRAKSTIQEHDERKSSSKASAFILPVEGKDDIEYQMQDMMQVLDAFNARPRSGSMLSTRSKTEAHKDDCFEPTTATANISDHPNTRCFRYLPWLNV